MSHPVAFVGYDHIPRDRFKAPEEQPEALVVEQYKRDAIKRSTGAYELLIDIYVHSVYDLMGQVEVMGYLTLP
jgi:hypothetical protein